MSRIKSNKAKCNRCGDVIESTWRNEIVTCSCGSLTVDGGYDYIRRGFSNLFDRDYEELSEYYVEQDTTN